MRIIRQLTIAAVIALLVLLAARPGAAVSAAAASAGGERLDDQRTGNPTVPGVLTVRHTRSGVHYRRVHQDLPSVPGSNQDGDLFGYSLGLP